MAPSCARRTRAPAAPRPDAGAAVTAVLVGGIGQLYQGDLDAGRVAVERLRSEALGPGVVVEDLYYGALAVMQRLEDLRPEALVLIAAVERGRSPAAVERRRIHPPRRSAEEIQTAVAGSITGYVGIELVIDVASGFGVLPPRTVAVEIEPVSLEPSTSLTPAADAALTRGLEIVRADALRAPVLGVADRLRELLAEDRLPASGAVRILRRLLDELGGVDETGEWGRTFVLRDRLREAIAGGEEPEGMGVLDWGLLWALVEGLDRLQPPGERISGEVSSNGGSSSSPRL